MEVVDDSMTPTPLRALVVDYGGVLTSSVADTVAQWAQADDIDPALFGEVLRAWRREHPGGHPVHELETGSLAAADFERVLAERLRTRSGGRVAAKGLLTRIFAGFGSEPAMVGVLRRARAAGLRTALLSNSWGNVYPREQWGELFDAAVISGEVGLRKPDADIYLLVAERLGVEPAACVFVDDLAANVRGAVAVGMVGVHHVDPVATIAELEVLFGAGLS